MATCSCLPEVTTSGRRSLNTAHTIETLVLAKTGLLVLSSSSAALMMNFPNLSTYCLGLSDGADVQIEAGTDGKITLREPGASPPVETTVGEMLATMTKMAEDMAKATEALNAANDKISTLQDEVQGSKDELASLKDEIVANMTKIDEKINVAATQLQDEVESNFETFSDSQAMMKVDVAANKDSTVKNAETLANAIETLDTDISNSKLNKKVAELKHIVGFATRLECADGYYREGGAAEVTCFPSGKYCATEKFGVDECGNEELPTCEPCDDKTCKVCSEGADQCSLCKDEDQIPVIGGNCRDAFNVIEVRGTSMKFSRATCLVVDGKAHTHIKCNDFQNGRACISTNMVTAANTCTANGFKHVPFRSKAHFSAAFNHFGQPLMERYWKTPGAIYSDIDQIGDLTQCALNSDSSCASGLKSIDGKDWWFRDGAGIGFNPRELQPSGDYTAECYFGIHPGPRMTENSFYQINDYFCQLYTGYFYMCGTSDF
eukprot:gene867-29749_t